MDCMLLIRKTNAKKLPCHCICSHMFINCILLGIILYMGLKYSDSVLPASWHDIVGLLQTTLLQAKKKHIRIDKT